MQAVTHDKLKRFDLTIAQPVDGYRFSLDALLLADFIEVADNARIADLGTGCGIIPLVLCKRFLAASVVGIDKNVVMADMARENAIRNSLAGRIDIIPADIVDAKLRFPVSSFDGVVANPPFRTPDSGRVSSKPGRDTARHESTAGIADFLAAAKYLVKPSGRIWFVYHPDRIMEFFRSAGEQNLSILRLRMVHGSLASPARIFLAELAKGRKGVTRILPPLVVHDENGGYTPEACRILGEGSGDGNGEGR